MQLPTVDDYVMAFGLREAIAHSRSAPANPPTRADVDDEPIIFAIDLAWSEILSYLGDRYSTEELERATGLPRMILQVARWNLDQRIEPRDFVRDQYREVLAQLQAIASKDVGLWLQPLPGEPVTPGGGEPVTATAATPLLLFGGGFPGFGSGF